MPSPRPASVALPPDYLSVADYDAAEETAYCDLPNRIIEEGQPFLFDRLNYPTRVRQNAAVWRFADTMHETRFANDVTGRLGGLTDEELDLCLTINRQVRRMSTELYGRPAFTTGSLIRALNVFRHIRWLYPEKGAVVLEIGPGCGYLGALLMMTGYRYVATDVTQGFYLYQNHLWRWLVGDGLRELAGDAASVADCLADERVIGIHLPWWSYMTWFRDRRPVPVDVVTANHMLCEMSRLSRRYTMKLTRRLLDGGARKPSFVFEGWGYDLITSEYEAYRGFRWNGFAMRHHDADITVFEPTIEPFRDDPTVRDMVWAYMRSRGPSEPPKPFPSVLTDKAGEWTERIAAGRAAIAGRRVHGLDSVVAALKGVLGTDSLQTPNEEFFAFLEHTE